MEEEEFLMEDEEVEMMDEDAIPRLLPEMWLHVLSFLNPKDLCTPALTCKGLSDLATLPRLWKKSNIRMIRFRTFSLQQFFTIRRFRHLSKLNFSRIKLKEDDIKLVLEWSLLSNLSDLDMTGLNLSPISPLLLSQSLHRLNKANVGFTKLTTDQTVELFNVFSSSFDPRQQELCLKAVNLSQVPPTALASAMCHLIVADLSFTELTMEQVTALFQRLAAHLPSNRLTSLDLFSVDLSLVCPLLLARAVTSLSKISLSNTELKLEHTHALFDQLLLTDTVTDLNLDFAELFSVPDEVLGRTVSKLTKASLACAVLDEDQLTTLATSLSLPSSKLLQLDLLDQQLTSLPPSLLLSGLAKLSKVNLSGSKLSPVQVDSLISGLDVSIMRDINLDYVDLSSCNGESLASLVCGLEVASLKKASLTESQVTLILTALMTQKHSLLSLSIHGNSLVIVDPSILSKAALTLTSLDLSNCLLPTDTASVLMSSLDSPSSSLRFLNMLGNRLGDVEVASLEACMTYLERLDLSSTALSVFQLEAVLEKAAPPLQELSLFSLDLGSIREPVLKQAETRVFVSHRHAAITPDS